MSIEQAREFVRAGVAFLDSRPDVPDNWRTLIDVSTLDMGDGYRCVLGQLAPHITGVTVMDGQEPYTAACNHLWPDETVWSFDDDSPVILTGFYPRFLFSGSSDLNQAWTEALAPTEVTP